MTIFDQNIINRGKKKMKKIISYTADRFTDYVIKKYDLKNCEGGGDFLTIPEINKKDIDDKKNWNILCILGSSGTGKTTILKQFGKLIEPKYNFSKSIISQFEDKTEEEVCEVFYSIGLSSVPLWLHKPNELSNGERARLDIAWQLLENKDEYILIDEFTSVVNRTTAKTMSFNLQKYLRRKNKKAVICSCHYDIIEWLQPDFIFNLNKKSGEKVKLEKVMYKDFTEYPIVDADKLLTKGRLL